MVVKETTAKRRSEIPEIELVLALFLRAGSVVAAALLALGLVDMVLFHARIAPKVITAGLVVLMSTPVMRVLVAGVIFVKEKDWKFAFFSVVVLIAVALGAFLGAI